MLQTTDYNNLHKNHSFSDENLDSCQVVEHTIDGGEKQKTMPTEDSSITKL